MNFLNSNFLKLIGWVCVYILPFILLMLFVAYVFFSYNNKSENNRLALDSNTIKISSNINLGYIKPYDRIKEIESGKITPFSQALANETYPLLFNKENNYNGKNQLAESWNDGKEVTLFFPREEFTVNSMRYIKRNKGALNKVGMLNAEMKDKEVNIKFKPFVSPTKVHKIISKHLKYIGRESLEDVHILEVTQSSGVAQESYNYFVNISKFSEGLKKVWFISKNKYRILFVSDYKVFLNELKSYYQANPDLDGVVSLVKSSDYMLENFLAINLHNSKIYWEDGKPVNEKDVLYTLELIRTNKVYFWGREFLADIISAQFAHKSLEFDFLNFMPHIMDTLTFPILPYHILGNLKEKEYSEYMNKPIGSGSWRVSEKKSEFDFKIKWSPRESSKVNTQKVISYHFSKIANDFTEIYKLSSGKLDLIELNQTNYKLYDDNRKYKIYRVNAPGFIALKSNGKYNDKVGKKLIGLIIKAINKEEINSRVFSYNANIINSIIINTDKGQKKLLKSESTEIELAKQELENYAKTHDWKKVNGFYEKSNTEKISIPLINLSPWGDVGFELVRQVRNLGFAVDLSHNIVSSPNQKKGELILVYQPFYTYDLLLEKVSKFGRKFLLSLLESINSDDNKSLSLNDKLKKEELNFGKNFNIYPVIRPCRYFIGLSNISKIKNKQIENGIDKLKRLFD